MVRSDEHAPRQVGRYVLFGELAAGGMATVHFGRLAGPVGFSRTVAIKRLHPQFAKDPEFVTMFLDEARLCGRIRHPNVVPTLDVVSLQGEIFIVMEYVSGEALSKLLRAGWTKNIPMPPRVAASIISSVLHGLHAAHQTKDEHGRELGIVHRDVSPQNILVGADGIARVLDFGVAKAKGRLQTTRDGQVKGKIAYMPPEQLSGALVSRQTDIYAAAVVLWEALAGRRLFDGETEAIVLARAIEGRIDPPSIYNGHLTDTMDSVVCKGLARDPNFRFTTAREFAVAIEQTIGLASPSEVGEWVEAVAADELARRTQVIAGIEAASLNLASVDPRIGMTPRGPGDIHSQVSSISVSRPAISSPSAVRRSGGAAKWFVASAMMLAGVGVGLGAFALRAGYFGSEAGSPNRFERESRTLSVNGPTTTAAKAGGAAGKEKEPDAKPAGGDGHRVVVRGPTAAQPAKTTVAVAPPPPAPKPNCDPPYTIDAAGHRKYKRECM
jgi:eukaryotic-like serine/threonine-protein kinase